MSDAVFLVDGSHSLQDGCHRHGFDFRYEKHGNRNAVERVFRDIKRRTTVSQTVSTTPKQKPPTNGSDHSASHGISLSDSMEILLSHASVNQDMGRKRPSSVPCNRARVSDWSECVRSRVMGGTARMPRGAASGKARIGESLVHAPPSRGESHVHRNRRTQTVLTDRCIGSQR